MWEKSLFLHKEKNQIFVKQHKEIKTNVTKIQICVDSALTKQQIDVIITENFE